MGGGPVLKFKGGPHPQKMRKFPVDITFELNVRVTRGTSPKARRKNGPSETVGKVGRRGELGRRGRMQKKRGKETRPWITKGKAETLGFRVPWESGV